MSGSWHQRLRVRGAMTGQVTGHSAGYHMIVQILCFQTGSLQSVKLISNETEAAEAVRKILSKTNKSEQMMRPTPTSQYSHSQPPPYQPHPSIQNHQATNDLQRAAEEILAGVKRPTAVESTMVQFVNGTYMSNVMNSLVQSVPPPKKNCRLLLATGNFLLEHPTERNLTIYYQVTCI